MEATSEMTQAATHKEYKSRASALKRFFEQSRDRWKNKYMELKATDTPASLCLRRRLFFFPVLLGSGSGSDSASRGQRRW
jgi:hypothetical protein